MAQFMESSPVSLQLAVHLAVAKCNSTIGYSGYTPAEIFTGRGWRSNEMIQIEVRKLLEQIVKRRESHRLAKERDRARRFMKKELQLVPYDDPSLNSPLITNQALVKIRVGDLVVLKSQQSDDKNKISSPWKVLDISFPKKVLHLKKVSGAEAGQGESKWIAFELVDKVFPKHERISHIQCSSELEEFEEEEADLVWLHGKQAVPDMVVAALVATHDLWFSPEDIGEELMPNLQFSSGMDSEVSEAEQSLNLSCRASEVPKTVVITPVKKEEEDWKEEFLTPEELATPAFQTPSESMSMYKKEEKKKGSPLKLQLEDSFEEVELPEPAKKPNRKSNRKKVPIDRFQPG